MLEPATPNEIPNRVQSPPPPVNIEGELEYEIAEIVRSLPSPCDSCRNPAESGGIKFGRQFCQICHSGDNKFRQNLAIPELTGTESGGMQ